MIIKCPECKNDISDQLEKCTNCGCPIRSVDVNDKTRGFEEDWHIKLKEFVHNYQVLIVFVIAAIPVFFILASVIGDKAESSDSYTYRYTPAIDESYYAWMYLDISDVDIEHNGSYTVATGTIRNDGTSTFEFVKVKGAFVDSSGVTVDTDWTYLVGSEGLSPNESKTFSMSVPQNMSIVDCEVSIID